MRFLWVWLFVLISMAVVNSQSLPQWSESDWALLEKGKIIAGASLLVDDAARPPRAMEVDENEKPELEILPDPSDDVEVDGSPYNAVSIPEEYWRDYFDEKSDSYLVDPQRLFSNQETLDQEGFLSYYAEESKVDMRVYLFDADQKLPDGYSLSRLVKDQYADGPLTAVVFYFLGNPKRNQVLFAGEGAQQVSADQLRKILDQARVKALEKSDPATQMESFIVQLSISIYWVELKLAELREKDRLELAGDFSASADERVEEFQLGLTDQIQPYFWYAGLSVLSGLALIGVLVFCWVRWRQSRRYCFPVLDFPSRLGGDYAAGIGAVIGFYDKMDSPDHQRRKIPEYLTRL